MNKYEERIDKLVWDFVNTLISNSKDIESEITEIVDNSFWDLLL